MMPKLPNGLRSISSQLPQAPPKARRSPEQIALEVKEKMGFSHGKGKRKKRRK